MPEGHAIHRLAQDLNEQFRGKQTTSSSPQGRFEAGASLINGRTLISSEAWGKHLLIGFDGLQERVHVHLGLYGAWNFGPPRPVAGQVRWRLAAGRHVADLRGPTMCALKTPGEVDAVLARLGPDPLRNDSDPELAWQRIRKSQTSIAVLLMDQRVLAGVGNVYRAEVLFRMNLDPLTPGRDLDERTWKQMWEDLVFLMKIGVERDRIDTVRPEHEPEVMQREPRRDDHGGEVYVYRRAGRSCHVCSGVIETTVLSGRNLFWCPNCQPRR